LSILACIIAFLSSVGTRSSAYKIPIMWLSTDEQKKCTRCFNFGIRNMKVAIIPLSIKHDMLSNYINHIPKHAARTISKRTKHQVRQCFMLMKPRENFDQNLELITLVPGQFNISSSIR
jgi:hypothetical protein